MHRAEAHMCRGVRLAEHVIAALRALGMVTSSKHGLFLTSKRRGVRQNKH